jgi:hypothetical protein
MHIVPNHDTSDDPRAWANNYPVSDYRASRSLTATTPADCHRVSHVAIRSYRYLTDDDTSIMRDEQTRTYIGVRRDPDAIYDIIETRQQRIQHSTSSKQNPYAQSTISTLMRHEAQSVQRHCLQALMSQEGTEARTPSTDIASAVVVKVTVHVGAQTLPHSLPILSHIHLL